MTLSESLAAPLAVAPGVVAGAAPADWRALRDSALVVLVGLSGVGKTTLSRRLVEAGLHQTPDRRLLTDRVILPAVAEVGEGGELDRAARFAATARFRARNPGGMADVLASLSVAPPAEGMFFDGLRGANEVIAFAAAAPRASFVALTAPDAVRVNRIAGRRDAFDRADSEARAMKIVSAEAENYDMEATLAALGQAAPGRHLVIDTVASDETAVARKALNFIKFNL